MRDRKSSWRDAALISVLALAAAAVLIVFTIRNRAREGASELMITVRGELYTVAPIQPGEDLTVAQPDGRVNVIRMVEGGFFMQSSTCKNQVCIHQGAVTRDNWRQRVGLYNHVICAPNEVDVSLVINESETAGLPDV